MYRILCRFVDGLADVGKWIRSSAAYTGNFQSLLMRCSGRLKCQRNIPQFELQNFLHFNPYLGGRSLFSGILLHATSKKTNKQTWKPIKIHLIMFYFPNYPIKKRCSFVAVAVVALHLPDFLIFTEFTMPFHLKCEPFYFKWTIESGRQQS